MPAELRRRALLLRAHIGRHQGSPASPFAELFRRQPCQLRGDGSCNKAQGSLHLGRIPYQATFLEWASYPFSRLSCRIWQAVRADKPNIRPNNQRSVLVGTRLRLCCRRSLGRRVPPRSSQSSYDRRKPHSGRSSSRRHRPQRPNSRPPWVLADWPVTAIPSVRLLKT